MENEYNIIKTLKPFGCFLVIICFIGFLGICFTSGGDNTIEGYSPPETESAEELLEELRANVLPELEGVVSCEMRNGKVVLELEKQHFFPVRKIILNYFDASLVEFVQAGQAERG